MCFAVSLLVTAFSSPSSASVSALASGWLASFTGFTDIHRCHCAVGGCHAHGRLALGRCLAVMEVLVGFWLDKHVAVPFALASKTNEVSFRPINSFPPVFRRFLLICVDAILLPLSVWLSFWLRLAHPFTPASSPLAVGCYVRLTFGLLYSFTGQYKGLTRYGVVRSIAWQSATVFWCCCWLFLVSCRSCRCRLGVVGFCCGFCSPALRGQCALPCEMCCSTCVSLTTSRNCM